MKARVLLYGLMAAVLPGVPAAMGSAAGADATALLDQTGVKGGLCLVIGAKAPSLATALAGKSALYVQVLQPDGKLASSWGLSVAGSTNGKTSASGRLRLTRSITVRTCSTCSWSRTRLPWGTRSWRICAGYSCRTGWCVQERAGQCGG